MESLVLMKLAMQVGPQRLGWLWLKPVLQYQHLDVESRTIYSQ